MLDVRIPPEYFVSVTLENSSFDPEIRGPAYVDFASPAVPSGMGYAPETQQVLPTDARYAASRVRVLGSIGLGVLLFVVTAGIGYLAWSVATWEQGQTRAQRLLGLRCWNPQVARALNRWQMMQRQFLALALSGLSLIVLVVFLVTGKSQTSMGDLILGTCVLHDPQGVLLN